MLLGCAKIRVGLNERQLRLIDKPARESTLLEQLLSALKHLPGAFTRISSGVDIRSSLHDRILDGGDFRGPIVRLGLLHRTLAFSRGVDEIAVLEYPKKLSLLDV